MRTSIAIGFAFFLMGCVADRGLSSAELTENAQHKEDSSRCYANWVLSSMRLPTQFECIREKDKSQGWVLVWNPSFQTAFSIFIDPEYSDDESSFILVEFREYRKEQVVETVFTKTQLEIVNKNHKEVLSNLDALMESTPFHNISRPVLDGEIILVLKDRDPDKAILRHSGHDDFETTRLKFIKIIEMLKIDDEEIASKIFQTLRKN